MNQYEAPRSVSDVELTGLDWTTNEWCPGKRKDYYYDCSALRREARARKQQFGDLLFVGERGGLRGVPYIGPREIHPSLLPFAMRSDSFTHPWLNGPGVTDTHGASCRDVGACCPPCLQGRAIEEKSVELKVGWAALHARVSISAPRRTSCDKWLGAVTVFARPKLTLNCVPCSRPVQNENGTSPLNPPTRRHPLRTPRMDPVLPGF